MDKIEDFAVERGLNLDDFQIEACNALEEGNSVLVAAPTGSGKTLIADFAIYLHKDSSHRVIYTTPIKALSNQKFLEFCELYSDENVGLATGDRSIRPHAKITIMTTEVLRNIIYSDPRSLDDVSYVILDEVHYISDRSRGAVWEEVIIQLPLDIDLVCLSATVSNAEEVAQWLTTVRGSTKAIIHETRTVPLSYWFSFRRKKQGLHVLPLLSAREKDDVHIHPDLYRALRSKGRPQRTDYIYAPRRLELIEYLGEHDMLPAIFFIFSRSGCDEALQACFNAHTQLTTSDERNAIREICDRHLDVIESQEFDALNYEIIINAMELGFAPHHAGLIPPLREAVEEAFVRGLVKVVFATETLAVGVNMPAKTVVIEKLTKFNGESHQVLTPGEFTQLTGRAGRRSLDVVGHAVVEWNRFVDFEQAAALASTRSYSLKSSFRPTYNMATNLIRSYAPDHARHILNLSLAQFQADDAVVSLERNLETKQLRMKEIRSQFTHTDKQFAGMVIKRVREMKKQPTLRESGDIQAVKLLRSLHAGDILDGFVTHQVSVVVSKGNARREPFIKIIDRNGYVHTLTSDHLTRSVRVIGHITLSSPINLRAKHFRQNVSRELQQFLSSYAEKSTQDENIRNNASEIKSEKIRRQNEMLDEFIACEFDVKRLTRRVQSRGQSLARQFERILALLTEYGYVDGWSLTDNGEVLSRINAEADLVIAEQICNNNFSKLSPPELVGLLATFIYESRGDEANKTFVFPTRNLEAISIICEDFLRSIHKDEREAGLVETRNMDYSMMIPAYKWAKGKDLGEVLDQGDITGGDFVRAMKSIVDLIRQIENATDNPDLITLCQKAYMACFRGIIVVSS